jgi:EmrB/QacA subfamily drug resistance transporter
MVILDASIVNIALPSAQQALDFSDASRQWVITGYALAFGSLLLLGGRLSDLWGAKRVFLVGAAGFGVASGLGGAATGFGMLVAARAGQGVFGALLAPAALAIVTTTFTDRAERARAFGVWGAIAGAGGGVGLLMGGVLTQELDWRWTMYVNVGLAVVAIAGVLAFVRHSPPTHRSPLDLLGTALASAGVFALVYGFANAETDGWTAPQTWGFLAAAALGLMLFVVRQARVTHPLLPLRVLADRDRGASFLALAIASVGIFSAFLFLTYYLQATLGYSPIRTGLAFLPMIATTIVGSVLGSDVLLARVGPKVTVPAGLLIAAAATVWLTTLDLTSSYTGQVLAPLLVLGLGLGLIFAPAISLATAGVDTRDSGVASGAVNTMQQIGGAVGIALLSTLSTSAASNYLADRNPADPAVLAEAALRSYYTAYWWGAAVYVTGAVLTALLYRPGRTRLDPDAAPAVGF